MHSSSRLSLGFYLHVVPHIFRPMGQDSPLCLFPANRRYGFHHLICSDLTLSFASFTPANGSVWSESQPRDSPQSEPVFVGYVLSAFWIRSTHNVVSEELPVRLAHRVKELDELPHDLSSMPSINKVKDWYAQSFEVGLVSLPTPMC